MFMHTEIKNTYVEMINLFLTEALSKTIMQQTRFRNNSLEISTDTKQRHMCLSLLGKEKNTYFENINKKDTKDSRNF